MFVAVRITRTFSPQLFMQLWQEILRRFGAFWGLAASTRSPAPALDRPKHGTNRIKADGLGLAAQSVRQPVSLSVRRTAADSQVQQNSVSSCSSSSSDQTVRMADAGQWEVARTLIKMVAICTTLFVVTDCKWIHVYEFLRKVSSEA
ncbi:hypothetical protein AXG93_4448s1040 [Marchantia polymorpha subsp. ruderalis]|uniref:Uncharacterized protein n=1 Tax=Marchantia polymorpha subsp. ruderalis TaxID=1480154 RepID=A0A176VCN8_MARPO|nr:hypothetical protein AXG93_4448s1040 [Marchantia polymorpha subsp. ruderalis]